MEHVLVDLIHSCDPLDLCPLDSRTVVSPEDSHLVSKGLQDDNLSGTRQASIIPRIRRVPTAESSVLYGIRPQGDSSR